MSRARPWAAGLAAVLAPEASERRRAVERLGTTLAEPAARYALRRLLAADPDAAVRAAAAQALGRKVDARPVDDALAMTELGWLSAALRDLSPVVRDAAVRALAERRAAAARCALERLLPDDPVWWVRRAAVYALGVVGGESAVPALRAALADPFWRVRHAAVQVLAALGQRQHDLRPQLLAETPPASAEYLRSLWGPALAPEEASSDGQVASRLPAELADRDPAVVTARLAAMDVPPAAALVELLCDPHVPLRRLAARRLAELGDVAALEAALRWLEEPRIPHVEDTVVELLDGLGDLARALVVRVLAGAPRRGAARWAVRWVAATRDDELAEPAWRCAVTAGAVAEGLALAPAHALVELLCERPLVGAPALDAAALALAAAEELLRRPGAERGAVLALVPPSADPEVAARLAVAAERSDDPHVLAAARSPDALPRAAALARLASAGLLPEPELAIAVVDPDPLVRGAVLSAVATSALPALLAAEPDPWLRRELAGALARAPGRLAPACVAALAADGDPWLRALSVARLSPREPDDAIRLLALTADPDPMVQAAVIDGLVALSPAELSALGQHTAPHGAAEPPVLVAWRAAANATPDADALAGALGGHAHAPSAPRGAATTPGPAPSRRAFGRSGVLAAPLVVSGAFELAPGSLHVALDAGADTFFWEPTYSAMTRFLRGRAARQRAQVVTGSYHADAASLRLDVERALRRLRRDALDVFLLFWARSPARLDQAAFEAMAALRREGKVRAIGFSTHDRELARAALAAAPWDVVMTRHSAAHPGLERELLSAARAAEVGVLTFSALCYGRMVAGAGAPSAADCYRYSLSQPGVTASISAPRRHRELVENLAVLHQPTLAVEALASLRAHGEGVRAQNQRFATLVRQPTRDAAAAAMAMLEAELPPNEAPAPSSPARRRAAAGPGPAARLRRGRL